MRQQYDNAATPWVIGIAIFMAMSFLAMLSMVGIPFILQRMNDDLPGNVQGDPSSPVMFELPGTGPALQYGGVPVHDACSLVTMTGLSSLDARLSRDHAVLHSHLAGDVPIAPDSGSSAVSSCSYTLWGREVVEISVHQTPFNTANALTHLVEEATVLGSPVRSSSGMSIASWHEEHSEHLAIWNANLVVSIALQTKESTGAFNIDALMSKLEPHVLARIASGPTAPMRHTYDSPAAEVKDPCTVASADAYAAAFPSSDSAASIVDGSYPLFAPIPESESGAGNARRVQLSCKRSNIADVAARHTLRVDLEVWDRPEAAARYHREAAGSFLAGNVSVTVSDVNAAQVIRSAGVFR